MTAEEIVQRTRDIVREELGIEEEKITDDARFREDFGADSLDIVEVVMCMEKAFDFDFPDEDADTAMLTFGSLTEYLTKRLANG